MIVIASKPGQLGNQLFLFAHILAFAMEHGIAVVNPAFGPYKRYFSAFDGRSAAYPARSGNHLVNNFDLMHWLGRIISKLPGKRFADIRVCDIGYDTRFDLDTADPKDFNALNIMLGWQFRAPRLLATHREEITEMFKPGTQLVEEVNRQIEAKKNHCDRLVGVHIRQGDYAYFEGGKYFFASDVYARFMRIAEQEDPNRHTAFLVTGNEKQDPAQFEGLDVLLSRGTAIEDLHALSQCDCIIGPPSTFSLWASFAGNIPLALLTDANTSSLHFQIPDY